jgi:alpha-L-rhamnosidase
MVKWIEYCKKFSTDLIRDKGLGGNYADWLNIEAFTSKEIVGTAFFAYSTKLMAQIAKALGKTEDAAKYEQLFLDIKAAFNKKFVTPDGRIEASFVDRAGKTILSGNTQAAYVLALKFDLLPEELREAAAQYLVEDITAKNGHLSTGFIGTGHLLPVLTQAGKTDTAFKLLLRDTFPSWLFTVKNGATSIWERWNGWTPEKGFFHPEMNSFNHYSFGAVGEWMFATLAGIDTDGPGFRKLLIRPTPGEGITWDNDFWCKAFLFGNVVSSNTVSPIFLYRQKDIFLQSVFRKIVLT